jgi:hypothetical protein
MGPCYSIERNTLPGPICSAERNATVRIPSWDAPTRFSQLTTAELFFASLSIILEIARTVDVIISTILYDRRARARQDEKEERRGKEARAGPE